MLPTTARSWTKLPGGQTTKSRKIGSKYIFLDGAFFLNLKFPGIKRAQAFKKLFFIYDSLGHSLQTGDIYQLFYSCFKMAQFVLSCSPLQKKFWLNFLNLGCFYPKSYSEINNIFLKYSSTKLRTELTWLHVSSFVFIQRHW